MLYLLTHQPGNLHTRGKAVRTPADLEGIRVRFAAVTIREYLAALGATPVGVPPPEIAEALQKGTIDGVFIDYGGAHTAFKLGGLVDYTTELYAYVTSFGVVMNPDSFERLPSDLQQLIEETTTGVSEEIGKLWDAADAPGRAYLQAEGGEAIVLTPEEAAASPVGSRPCRSERARGGAEGLDEFFDSLGGPATGRESAATSATRELPRGCLKSSFRQSRLTEAVEQAVEVAVVLVLDGAPAGSPCANRSAG